MKRYVLVILLQALLVSCGEEKYHPPKEVADLVSKELDKQNICDQSEPMDLEWINDSVEGDITYYRFNLYCLDELSSRGLQFSKNEFLVVYHADSIEDLSVKYFDYWNSLFPTKFDIRNERYWKEPLLLMLNDFSFEDSVLIKKTSYSQIQYSKGVSLKIGDSIEFTCDTLIWSPYHDAFFTNGSLVVSNMKNGDTTRLFASGKGEFAADFSEYKIERVTGVTSTDK